MKIIALFLFLVAGCARSLVPGYEKPIAYYRPPSGLVWKVHIASQWRVSWECQKVHPWIPLLPLFAHGCTTDNREIWVIDSWAISKHECGHAKALDEGGSQALEWIKDITYDWNVTNAIFLATLPVPARDKPCGEDADGTSKSRWAILPSVDP